MANIIGTDAADILDGTSDNDTIEGKGGKDRLDGRSGNDVVRGGGGEDTIDGGKGADTLSGGNGTDLFDFRNEDTRVDTLTDFSQDQGDLIRLFNTDDGSPRIEFVNTAGGQQVFVDGELEILNRGDALGLDDFIF